MRIVSWNCNGALRKKFTALDKLNFDICIIQECENPAEAKDARYRDWASNYLWQGGNKNKGLGIFAKSGIKLDLVALEAGRLELFLPCMVNQNIFLLAVWTRQANSPTFGYIGQLCKYLQQHKPLFAETKALIIGDLNSNSRWDAWDRWWNHSDVVRELSEIGIKSLYHHQYSEPFGRETKPTFYMYRKREKPYHIDYAFLPEKLLESAEMEIGSPENWLEHSDHMPLIIETKAR